MIGNPIGLIKDPGRSIIERKVRSLGRESVREEIEKGKEKEREGEISLFGKNHAPGTEKDRDKDKGKGSDSERDKGGIANPNGDAQSRNKTALKQVEKVTETASMIGTTNPETHSITTSAILATKPATTTASILITRSPMPQALTSRTAKSSKASKELTRRPINRIRTKIITRDIDYLL